MTTMIADTVCSWICLQAKPLVFIGVAAFCLSAVQLAGAGQVSAQPPTPNALKALALKKIDQCLRRTATYLDSAEARRERLCQTSGCSVYLRMCSTPAEQMVTEKTLELVEHHAPQITQDCLKSIGALLEQQPRITAEDRLPFEAALEAPTLALSYRYELVHRMVHSSECKP